jgi:hypothetical protein
VVLAQTSGTTRDVGFRQLPSLVGGRRFLSRIWVFAPTGDERAASQVIGTNRAGATGIRSIGFPRLARQQIPLLTSAPYPYLIIYQWRIFLVLGILLLLSGVGIFKGWHWVTRILGYVAWGLIVATAYWM